MQFKTQTDGGGAGRQRRLEISLARQELVVWEGTVARYRYAVSTALKGAGQQEGSGQTPTGRHRIRALIGAGAPEGAVFVGRRPTGEIYSPALAARYPQRDWILSRILWLCGLEPGHNRFGNVDSMRRFIYIHGTPDSEPMGVPRSHGCVRMRNRDVIRLFEFVRPGDRVLIKE